MRYSKLVRDIAARTGLTPEQVRGIETVYDLISRFGFVRNARDLDRLMFQSGGKVYNLPYRLTEFIKKHIFYHGQRTFYRFSEHKKPEELERFVNYFIANKIQPSSFYFSGTLVFRKDAHTEVAYMPDYELPKEMA